MNIDILKIYNDKTKYNEYEFLFNDEINDLFYLYFNNYPEHNEDNYYTTNFETSYFRHSRLVELFKFIRLIISKSNILTEDDINFIINNKNWKYTNNRLLIELEFIYNFLIEYTNFITQDHYDEFLKKKDYYITFL